MPKNIATPRLSIVVPIGRDLAAFESTLISVLENRPFGGEIFVAHDGSYDDPFDLCDEVQFVIGKSDRITDLVTAAVTEARAPFVHILADGVRATHGWAEHALEMFEEQDAATVAPVIRDAETMKIIAAGWIDGQDRLCKPACYGRDDVWNRTPEQLGGYLQSSFWRREVLQSLTHSFRGLDDLETTYAFQQAIRASGWRCVLAQESELMSDQPTLAWDFSSFGRGRRLRAIRNRFDDRGGWGHSIRCSLRATITSLGKPGQLAEAAGQAISPLGSGKLAKHLAFDLASPCVEENTPHQSAETYRRAA